jgi:hypothetical protein
MVQVAEGDAAGVQRVHPMLESIEKGVVTRPVLKIGKGFGVDALEGEAKGPGPSEKARQARQPGRRTVGAGLAPKQQAAEGIANEETARPIVLDRDLEPVEAIQ